MSDEPLLKTDLLPISYPGSDIRVHSAWATFSESSHLNLAGHTGADPKDVQAARELLQNKLGIESLTWLNQQHTTEVAKLAGQTLHELNNKPMIADASVTTIADQACAVLTADCVPIVLVDPHEPRVAAVHAGWRGLVQGIVKNTLNTFAEPSRVHAYIGPCISPQHFEVGQEVFDEFVASSREAQNYFEPVVQNSDQAAPKWLADLPGLTAAALKRCGVRTELIQQSRLCTYSDARFPSYRLNKTAARMASLIWFTKKGL